MPEDALIEFPPGFAARSRMVTGMEWAINSVAAERPARPEPITIALFGERGMVDDMMVEVRWRQSMEVRAMKREMVISVRTRFRGIGGMRKIQISRYATYPGLKARRSWAYL